MRPIWRRLLRITKVGAAWTHALGEAASVQSEAREGSRRKTGSQFLQPPRKVSSEVDILIGGNRVTAIDRKDFTAREVLEGSLVWPELFLR